ncbi:MAG TPA: NAD-dependent epimerase/dehydratase family protein [Solirubrobacteraceae bacterium]|nr:NAD-dependent epimerase/dehydratase family protein [Solirubrobacteraceae bacterium]
MTAERSGDEESRWSQRQGGERSEEDRVAAASEFDVERSQGAPAFDDAELEELIAEAGGGGEEDEEDEEDYYNEEPDELDEEGVPFDDYAFIEKICKEGYYTEEEARELVLERRHWPEWSYLRLDEEERIAGKRALVTGGAGFIGSHVAELLLERGYRVLVVDDLSSGRIENVPDGAMFEKMNLVDDVRAFQLAYHFCPDYVFHLAAQASVTVSVQSPFMDFFPNVVGTFNVLEGARSRNSRFVFASTGGALYGEDAPLPTNEDFPPDPLSPYGIGKLCCEIYTTHWARLYECPNTVLRLANVYGPRQNPHGEAGVVAIFSQALRNGEAPRIYGDGEQTRDYIHVRDVAAAFVAAAERPSPGVYNVGTGVQTSVNRLWELLQGVSGRSVTAQHMPPRMGELRRSALDATRMREAFGWEPKVGLEEGLAETYAYYTGGLPSAGR